MTPTQKKLANSVRWFWTIQNETANPKPRKKEHQASSSSCCCCDSLWNLHSWKQWWSYTHQRRPRFCGLGGSALRSSFQRSPSKSCPRFRQICGPRSIPHQPLPRPHHWGPHWFVLSFSLPSLPTFQDSIFTLKLLMGCRIMMCRICSENLPRMHFYSRLIINWGSKVVDFWNNCLKS